MEHETKRTRPRQRGGSGGGAAPALALLLLLSTGAAACHSGGGEGSGGPPPAPVKVGEVSRKDVPIEVRAVGSVESIATVDVQPQVSGTLQQVLFDQGAEVTQGDVLFRIDPAPFEAALAQAKANLAQARAQAKNARTELGRQRTLRKRNLTTGQAYTQALAQSRAAAAAVKAGEAAVQSAQLQLGYATIEAPISGKTGALQVTEGNVVGPGRTLVTIEQLRPVYVAFSVPAADLEALRHPTRPLTVTVSPPGTQASYQGSVGFVDNSVDAKTGTVRVKATLPNRDEALWPGQFVRVVLELGVRNDALVVPSEAVQRGQKGTYVFVLKDDGTVASVPVDVVQQNPHDTVIGGGLSPGRKVVTDGQLRLTPGTKVEVVESLEGQGPQESGAPAS